MKKAYRKKALELHPDRNYGNVDIATRHFAEVQAAYEILSDPQERAWYDSHRDAILRGGDDSSEGNYERTVQVTVTADILSFFSRYHGQLDYSDSERGFFTTVRLFFDKVAAEEYESYEWKSSRYQDFPGFGIASDSFNDTVKPFYNIWGNFSTKKSFSWEDRFRTTDAPDRRVRRIMEKENKRCRDEGIRMFNEAVRSLVAFIKKRDPRYVSTSQSEADRQKALRDATIAQAARSRAANQAKIDPQPQPEWTKTEPTTEGVFEESSEDDLEAFECVVCSKMFKSEKQWQAHEKSKKHLKAVLHLRKKMKVENVVLGLNEEGQESMIDHKIDIDMAPTHPMTEIERMATLNRKDRDSPENRGLIDGWNEHVASSPSHSIGGPETECLSSGFDDVYTSKETMKGRTLTEAADHLSLLSDSDLKTTDMLHSFTKSTVSSDRETSPNSEPKVGKAKEKRAKKAARKAGTVSRSREGEVRYISSNDACAYKIHSFSVCPARLNFHREHGSSITSKRPITRNRYLLPKDRIIEKKGAHSIMYFEEKTIAKQGMPYISKVRSEAMIIDFGVK